MKNINRSTYLVLLSFVLGMLLSSAAFAQTATIAGTITDASGGGVPDATVTVTNIATHASRKAATDASGTYSIPNVAIGQYDASFEKTGFATLDFKNLTLTVAQNLTLNGTLTVGSVSAQVQVEGSVIPTIDLDTAQISTVVDQRTIEDLPLLTRDPYSLVLLSPGVEQTNSSSGGFSVNGQRDRNNNFLLDGVDNNDASVPGIPGGLVSLNPDDTQEYRVITNNYLPEFGRNTGAVVDVAIRSGTNSFHGNGYEFNRVSALAARDYFNPTGTTQNPFVRNQFGFSIGGPIVKNKTFFFFNQEWQRFITTLTTSAVVPTPAFKSGVFSYAATDANGNPLPAQAINLASPGSPDNLTGSVLDPTIQRILAAYPNPNGPAVDSIRALYYFPSPSRAHADNSTFRVDHRFTDKYTVSAHFLYDMFSDPDGFHDENLPGLGATATGQVSQDGALNFIAALRPNLVNEFRFGINRANNVFTCGAYNTINQFGTPDAFGLGTDYSFSTVNSGNTIGNLGCTSLGDSNGQARRAGTWQYIDNLSWIKGKHNIKAGGEFRYIYENGYDGFSSRPTVDFTAFENGGIQVAQCSTCTSDVAAAIASDPILQTMSAALLGIPGTQTQTQFFNAKGQRTAVDLRHFLQHEYGAFVQDVWKVLPTLTLDFGVRYEFNGIPFERNGNLSNLFVDASSPAPLTFQTAGPGTGRNLYNNDPYDIEPRVGLAWDPAGNGKTSVRMGYGIFHDRVFGNLFGNLKGNPPFVAQVQNFVNASGSPITTVTQLAPPATQPSPSATVQDGAFISANVFDPNLKMPYTQAWNAGVQRELFAGFALDLNYVASTSHRILRVVDGNPPQPNLVNSYIAQGDSPSFLSGGKLRYGPFVGVPQVTGNLALYEPGVTKSIGNATYNSLQAVLNRRMSHGVQMQIAYTWSHAIDDASDPLTPAFGNRAFPRNSFNLHEERGNSDFDLRQRLVFDWLLELPFGPGRAFLQHGFLSRVVGGWEVTGLSQFQAGMPYDIFGTRDTEHTGLSGRPDVVGDPTIPAGSSRLQTGPPLSAFALAPYGRPGSLGRNTFVGPKFFNTDVNLSKKFAFTEQTNLQFRAEVYNVFNQVQLGQPVNSLASTQTFGQSTAELTHADGTTAARQIQLALKLVF